MIQSVTRSRVWASSLSLAVLLLTGCYVEEVRRRPPEYVASPAPPAQEVVVESPPAPPPPVVEPAPPPPPSADEIWVAGYYGWSGQRYEWRRGHYERRPRPGARYSTGHWEQRARGKVWIEARWE